MEAVSSYIQTLERRLDCPKGMRDPFLTRTRRMADDFVRNRPEATRQELVDYLGEPQDLAQGFLETLDPDVLESYHRRKQIFRRGCVAVLVVALVASIAWGFRVWHMPMQIEKSDTIVVYGDLTYKETTEEIS